MRKSVFSQPATLRLTPNRWDIMALFIVLGVIIAFAWSSQHMTEAFNIKKAVQISLGILALPKYALFTVTRMFIALFISFVVSFVLGALAAKYKRAEQLIIPLIDVLQSVPILGYLSILSIFFISLFPNSLFGAECVAIFAVFTSQVWNMILSFYQSLRTIPVELNEASHMFHLSAWQRFWRLEVPYAMPGLLWNAMMSMSGGWFFIVAAEAFTVMGQQIMLPGIGSYIATAIHAKALYPIFYAILTMLVVIILYDQLFFRPLVAWSHKFSLTDTPDERSNSWVLNLLQRTTLVQAIGDWISKQMDAFINLSWFKKRPYQKRKHVMADTTESFLSKTLWYLFLSILLTGFAYVVWRYIYQEISIEETSHVFYLGILTGLRVFILIFLCSLVWVPVGIYAGMRPKVAQKIQPIAQIFAAFPADLFYPLMFFFIITYKLDVNFWCAPLMILGTQWYILFNVIAGASNIPKELKLAAENMQLRGWIKWKRFYLPAIFPYFVTGAITAAGGAWNASIVAELIEWGHTKLMATGLGAYITENTNLADFPRLALGILVMCLLVSIINRVFWRQLYHFAETRCKL